MNSFSIIGIIGWAFFMALHLTGTMEHPAWFFLAGFAVCTLANAAEDIAGHMEKDGLL